MEMLWGVPWYRDVLFHADYGTMINSGPFSGTPGDKAKAAGDPVAGRAGLGGFQVNYRLRDWLISRQRYWGAPIPIVYCGSAASCPCLTRTCRCSCPTMPSSCPPVNRPLKYHQGFLNTTCPKCGGPAQRETDTMDTFMCSSWYHYAYVSPYYQGDVPFDPEKGKYWLPVDQYTGGIEHATMHLIYTRFFTKAMRDMGLVDFDEPMLRLAPRGSSWARIMRR
jgi:leucyl-tRNA synthetase